MTRREEKFSEPTKVSLHDVNVYDHPGFRYTTPSAIMKALTPKQRRDIGCYEKPVKKYCFTGDTGKAKCHSVKMEAEALAGDKNIYTKIEKQFTGGRCPGGSNVCPESVQIYDERCKSATKPCGSARATCPVQLVWVKGKPNLRFCMEAKKPGYLVPVRDVEHAMKLSDEACQKWPYQLGVQAKAEGSEEEGWDADFFDRNAPQIPVLAKEAYPESGGLGRLGRSRRGGIGPVKGGAGGLWLGIGLAMGLTAAVLLKGARAPAK
jgi:hypothetical protein